MTDQLTNKPFETNTADPTPLIKRYKIPVVVGLVTIVLLSLAGIFYFFTPEEGRVPRRHEPVPQPTIPAYNYDNKTIPIKKIKAEGVVVDVPTTAVIYENSYGAPNLKSIAENLADLFDLSQQSDKLWTSDTQVLHLEAPINAVTISQNNPPIPEKTGFNQDQLITASLTQLQQLGLAVPDQKYLEFEISYFVATTDLDPVEDPTKSNVAIVRLRQKINDWKLMYVEQTNTFTQLTFNPDYQLVSLAYVPLIVPKPLYEMKTFDLEEVLKNIEGGSYTIVGALQESGVPVNLTTLEYLTFIKGVLEYRYFPDVNKLYPYYRFSGTGYEISPEFTYAVEVITPAMQTAPTPQEP